MHKCTRRKIINQQLIVVSAREETAVLTIERERKDIALVSSGKFDERGTRRVVSVECCTHFPQEHALIVST